MDKSFSIDYSKLFLFVVSILLISCTENNSVNITDPTTSPSPSKPEEPNTEPSPTSSPPPSIQPSPPITPTSLPLPSNTPNPITSPQTPLGQTFYNDQCQSCHGEFGEGNDLLGIPSLLDPICNVCDSRDALIEFIHTQMPVNSPEQCTEECAELAADFILNDLPNLTSELPEPIAYFTLNQNVEDSGPNAYHGQLIGDAIYIKDRYDRENQALFLDGANDSVTVPININATELPQLTLSAWVRADLPTKKRVLFSHDNGGFDRTITIDDRSEAGPGWSVFTGENKVVGSIPASISEWVFIAVVYDEDKKSITLYVNDEVLETQSAFNSGGERLSIGSNPGFNRHFAGGIDDVRVFNQALNANQIKALKTLDDPEEPLLTGEQLFNQLCAGCHGLQGLGVQEQGPALSGNQCLSCNEEETLIELIQTQMPANEPENCIDDCARKIAQYIRENFDRFSADTPELVAHFNMDNSVIDDSGNGYHALIFGTPSFTEDRFGNKNSAIQLDGVDDSLLVQANINPSAMPTMSVTAWVKTENLLNAKRIYSNGNGSFRGRQLGQDRLAPEGPGWTVFDHEGQLSSLPLVENEWTFVASVYDQDNQTITLYVNDQSLQKISFTADGARHFKIGSIGQLGRKAYFQGAIDDLRLFNHALNANDIQSIFEGSVESPEIDTVEPISSNSSIP